MSVHVYSAKAGIMKPVQTKRICTVEYYLVIVVRVCVADDG